VDFEASNNVIMQGETVDFTDLSLNEPDSWQWTFAGGIPETSTEQNPQGILYPDGGDYTVKLTASNVAGTDSLIKEDYIHVDWVGVEKFKSPHDFHIFPNPGSGKFIVEFATSENKTVTLEVVDASGKIMKQSNISKSGKQIMIDLTSMKNGLYFVRVKDGNKTVSKQVSIVR